MDVTPSDVLRAHVERFNEAIRSGDFAPMVSGFAIDAVMGFEGVKVGPFVGRDAIARAYADQPPSDEIRLLGAPAAEGDAVESEYAWASEGSRAGRMILTSRDGAITRLIVTFE